MKKIIKIKDLLGDKLITYSQGDIVYNIVKTELSEDKKVVLDFEGVMFSSGAFFNATIGKLILKYGIEKIKSSVSLVNLSNSDKFILRRTIAIAKRTAEGE